MLWKSARNSLRLNIHVLNSLGFLQHNYNIFVNLEESTSVKLFAPRARYTPQGKNENKQRLENVFQKRPCCMIWALLAWRLAYSYSIMFVRLNMILDTQQWLSIESYTIFTLRTEFLARDLLTFHEN